MQVRWCDRCVALVGEHGDEPPKAMLMLGGMESIPLPEPESEYLYLREIETVVAVEVSSNNTGSSDVAYFTITVKWDSESCPNEQRRKCLNDMSWSTEHRFSEFAWLDAQLRSRLGKHGMPCRLPDMVSMKRSIIDYYLKAKDDSFLETRALGLDKYMKFLANHVILRRPISEMRNESMRCEFIEAAQLVRVFLSLNGGEGRWSKVQMSKNSNLETSLSQICGEMIQDIENFDDIT